MFGMDRRDPGRIGVLCSRANPGRIGVSPNATNFSHRQQGHRKERVLPWERGQSCPHGSGTAPPPYCSGSADVLVGKKYGAGGQGRRGRRRSQGISQSPATRCRRKEDEKGCEKLVALGKMPMLPVRGRPCQRSTGFPTRGATDKKVRSPLPCLQKGARASRPMTLTFQGASRF